MSGQAKGSDFKYVSNTTASTLPLPSGVIDIKIQSAGDKSIIHYNGAVLVGRGNYFHQVGTPLYYYLDAVSSSSGATKATMRVFLDPPAGVKAIADGNISTAPLSVEPIAVQIQSVGSMSVIQYNNSILVGSGKYFHEVGTPLYYQKIDETTADGKTVSRFHVFLAPSDEVKAIADGGKIALTVSGQAKGYLSDGFDKTKWSFGKEIKSQKSYIAQNFANLKKFSLPKFVVQSPITFGTVPMVGTLGDRTKWTFSNSDTHVTYTGWSDITTPVQIVRGTDGSLNKVVFNGSGARGANVTLTPIANEYRRGDSDHHYDRVAGRGALDFKGDKSDVSVVKVEQSVTPRRSTVLDWFKRNVPYIGAVAFGSWGLHELFHGDTSSLKVGATLTTPGGDKEGSLPTNKSGGDASNADNSSLNGGIDLTAEQMNLQLQNAGKQIKFNVDPAMLAQLRNVPGFTPVVMGMQVMTEASFRQFLGI